jgi:uncharacterized protein
MGVSNSKEPDAEVAESIARRGCILRGLVGSTVHGLSNPGTDDRDEMGVCVEPPQYIAGLRPFEHWVYRTQPEGARGRACPASRSPRTGTPGARTGVRL